MHVKLRFTVAAAVLALASPALATNGMRMIGFGPVQNSMGGVSVGAPLDAATVITNPAGISFTGGRIDFGASYFDATVKYTAEGAAPMFATGVEQESGRRASPIPAFGLVFPGPGNVTFGIGAYGVSGIGVDYPQDLYGGKTFTSYSEMRFAPGLSYKVLPNLSIGAVANVMYSTMEYTVAGGMGMAPRDMAIAYGAGVTVGLTYKPMEDLTVGLAYESKSFFQDYEFNIPQHDVIVGFDPGTGAPIIATVGPGVETLDFDQPSQLTLGFGYRPIEGLLLAADFAWIRWSETNGENQPEITSDPNATGARAFNLDWEDQWVVKVGAEYAALPWLKLRAGWNYGKQPLNEDRAFENIAFPAIAEHHVTAGVGLDFGKASINVGGMYAPEVKVTGSNPAEQGILAYETKMSEWSLDAGVSYRF